MSKSEKEKQYSKGTIDTYARTGKEVFLRTKTKGQLSLGEAKKILKVSLQPLRVCEKLGFLKISGEVITVANDNISSAEVNQQLVNYFKAARPLSVPGNKKQAAKKPAIKKAAKKKAKPATKKPAKKAKSSIKPLRSSTVKLYATVIESLRSTSAKKPLKMSSTTFAKKHGVSTNLLLALVDKKYVERRGRGDDSTYSWIGSQSLKSETIAARVITYLNKHVYTPSRKAAKKAAKKLRATDTSGSMVTKAVPIPAGSKKPLPRNPRKEEADGRELAKRFTDLGEYGYALKVLDTLEKEKGK